MPNTNWNAEWESNFEPVRLGTSLGLRAPFHEPMGDVDLELVMMPKMSFGTGHHETTLLMSWWLLGAPTEQTIQIGQKVLWESGPQRVDTVEGLLLHQNPTQDISLSRLKGIRVLDMGCGTGILGILAARLGASSVIGIDVEAWSAENAAENATRNAVPAQGSYADWLCGDAEMLPSLWAVHGKFDLILANINRNILLKDMAAYDDSLQPGGQLWLSGFYIDDHGVLLQEAKRLGLVCVGSAALNQWSTLLFAKV
jgi:ribosomal protein L11 methyltransferase